jgi:hypothetical protein
VQLPSHLQRFVEIIFGQFHFLSSVIFGAFMVLVFISLSVTEITVVMKLAHLLLRLWANEF